MPYVGRASRLGRTNGSELQTSKKIAPGLRVTVTGRVCFLPSGVRRTWLWIPCPSLASGASHITGVRTLMSPRVWQETSKKKKMCVQGTVLGAQ